MNEQPTRTQPQPDPAGRVGRQRGAMTTSTGRAVRQSGVAMIRRDSTVVDGAGISAPPAGRGAIAGAVWT
jgi:hypothetical protein